MEMTLGTPTDKCLQRHDLAHRHLASKMCSLSSQKVLPHVHERDRRGYGMQFLDRRSFNETRANRKPCPECASLILQTAIGLIHPATPTLQLSSTWPGCCYTLRSLRRWTTSQYTAHAVRCSRCCSEHHNTAALSLSSGSNCWPPCAVQALPLTPSRKEALNDLQ